MLSGEFELDLVTTEPEKFVDARGEGLEVHGGVFESSIRGEVRALREYLRENEPSAVVQLTDPPVHGTIAGFLSKRYGVPFVYRYAGDRFYEYRVTRASKKLPLFVLNNVVGRVPLRYADRFIVLGPTGRKRLEERGIDPYMVEVLPPSVDSSLFSRTVNDAAPGIPEDAKVVLLVGRLSRMKGLGLLKRTIPEVLRERNDLHFLFVGGGRGELSLPEEHSDSVSLVGSVPPQEMPSYYAEADLLAHPALTEGLPRVLIEALTTGTPVLARDVGEIGSVTSNTFETDEQFVEMLVNFERLPLDDASSFSRESLKKDYVDFFRGLVQH